MSDDTLAAPRVRRPRMRPSRQIAYVALAILVVWNVGVFIWLVLQSLKTNSEFLTSKPWDIPAHWQWANFVTAWQQANIGGYVGNSVLVSVGATLLSIAVSAPAAYALARFPPTRASAVVRNAFFAGLLVSPVILIVPLYFELVLLHLIDNLAGLVLVYAGLSLPSTTWYLSSFFLDLPKELEEAAATDGAGVVRAFLSIFLPNAIPGCLAISVVNLLWAWNEFYYALTFLNTDSSFTIALGVFNLQVNADYSANWVILVAGMLISMSPVLIVYGLLSQQITRAMGQGAVKG